MRLSSSLLQCCALLGCASAQQGLLYAFENHWRDDAGPAIVSSDTANFILARRHGVTDGLSLQGIDEPTLADISKYGGHQEPLFGESSSNAPARVFVRITGQSFDWKKNLHAFTKPSCAIQRPSMDLLSDFKTKDSIRKSDEEAELCRYEAKTRDGVKFSYILSSSTPCASLRGSITSSDGQPVEQIIEFFKEAGFYNQEGKPTFGFSTFDVDFSQTKLSSKLVNSQIDQLISQLGAMYTTENMMGLWTIQPTLLLLPSPSELTKPSSRKLLPRQLTEEEPLDLDLTTPSTSFDPSPLKSNYTTHPLPSRFPACFSSKSACTNATNACSGHGTCSLSAHGSECYTCHCARTLVRTNADGSNKTVAWAGAACQKKDVSVEFFLFAGFGIFMMALVSGAIGMLYTMGGEQLPSVIGAGVAGVSRK